MPAQLIALNDGPSILVDKPILLVGRHPECDVQIDSRKISRRHCCIAQINDYLVVRDLDSTNGVRVNGVRVLEGRLNAGDELTIANHHYRVAWQEASPRGGVPRLIPGNGTVDEDDMLEACDEPVALPEPPRAKPVKTEESFVLPDELELMPNSGSFPGGAAPAAQT